MNDTQLARVLKEKITDWILHGDTCYLFGAGCSVCAGKPTMAELTDKIMDQADEDLKQLYNDLNSNQSISATIEDLMTLLNQYRAILNTTTSPFKKDISICQVDKWISSLKCKIVETITDSWAESEEHKRFLQRLSLNKTSEPIQIFSLNYDTVLEASLESLMISYTDGFRGSNRAWFDPVTFKERNTSYQLFKLHGSIDWVRDNSDHIRRISQKYNIGEEEIVLIYPSEQKYVHTQSGIYESMLNNFRSRLREPKNNNCLIVLGYSFGDQHINEAIVDSINYPNSKLTVIAFVGPHQEDLSATDPHERLKELASRCGSRFNAFVWGNKPEFIGRAFDDSEIPEIIKADLWKFENLVRVIAGDES